MATVEHEHEREREFGIDELFFSTTDAKGIIKTGNEVFQRVSAYDEVELIGKPHSTIRHPDMPRCVFKLMWDMIESGQAIAAYVKNRAKTGEPYWVMATVTPCEGGYLSVRMKPSSQYLDIVKAVYPELRKIELELGGDREINRKDAMAASGARLTEILAGAGFPDYTSFMITALTAELASRAARVPPPALPTGPQRRSVDHVRKACLAIIVCLDSLFGADFEGHAELMALNHKLAAKSEFVLELAESLRLFSLNTLLASSRLGDDGVVLHAIAGIMRRSSDSMRGMIKEFVHDLKSAEELLGDVGARVAIARLQALMSTLFIDEVHRNRRPGAQHARNRDPRLDDVALLANCLSDSLGLLRNALDDMDTHLGGVTVGVSGLSNALKVMSALQTNGRIEAARIPDAGAVVLLFREIQEQIQTARAELTEFAAIAQRGRGIASREAIKDIDDALQDIRENTARLTAPRRGGRAPSEMASSADKVVAFDAAALPRRRQVPSAVS
ncbi:MAG: PAS domain-containing protein [Solirubrobacteraceae bacterium]